MKESVKAFYEALGAKIAEARKRLGLSQLALAGRVGISRATMVGIEAGKQGVPVHTLVWIANALGVPPQDLIAESFVTDPTQANTSLDEKAWMERVLGEVQLGD